MELRLKIDMINFSIPYSRRSRGIPYRYELCLYIKAITTFRSQKEYGYFESIKATVVDIYFSDELSPYISNMLCSIIHSPYLCRSQLEVGRLGINAIKGIGREGLKSSIDRN
jgi:hypothetical protein